jgi:hypothetical protein
MELNRAHAQKCPAIVAMTNEERFIASCQTAGELDVRQKLNSDRYGGLKAGWASNWLEQVESAKSDATKAEEKNSRLAKTKPSRNLASPVFALLLVLLLAGAFLFLKFR